MMAKTGIQGWLVLQLLVCMAGNKHCLVALPSNATSSTPSRAEQLLNIDTAPSCKTKLMVMIVSDVRQRWKRDALRGSWASPHGGLGGDKVRYFFVVGMLWDTVPPAILQEADEYQDIIIVPTDDFDFSMYTHKVVHGMQLAARNCRFEYFLKVTEFSFVNMFTIGQWLEKLPPKGVYRGRIIHAAGAQRNANSVWYMPTATYSRAQYPPYAQHAFLLSRDLFGKVVEMEKRYRDVYYDDVAVAVWLSDHDIHPIQDTAVSLNADCQAPVIIELTSAELAAYGENMRERGNHIQCYAP